jgi:hypothetical protein
MPSTNSTQRRRFLAGLGASLVTLSGCVGRQAPSSTESGPGTERTPTPEPDPSDTPAPEAEGWPVSADGNVLSIDATGEALFAVVGGGSESDSRMVALAPDGSVRWETPFEPSPGP